LLAYRRDPRPILFGDLDERSDLPVMGLKNLLGWD
jgi:hypothetical protein